RHSFIVPGCVGQECGAGAVVGGNAEVHSAPRWRSLVTSACAPSSPTATSVLGSLTAAPVTMEYTPVGQTTQLAARMEQLADPGSILMTADTFSLAGGHPGEVARSAARERPRRPPGGLRPHRRPGQGARAPDYRDDDVPRDGHELLAGEGG